MKKFFTLIAMFLASSAALFAQEEETKWKANSLVNGDLEGTDYSAFHLRPNSSETGNSIPEEGGGDGCFELDADQLDYVDGEGVDGSKALKITSYKGAENAWQCQFWVRLPEVLQALDKVKISFDVRAKSQYFADLAEGDEAALTINTQAHSAACSYIHYSFAGDVTVTNENWLHFEQEVTIDGSMAGSNGMGSMAMNLSGNANYDVDWYFDNFTVQYEDQGENPPVVWWQPLVKNGDFEGEDTGNYIVRIKGQNDVAPEIEEGIGVDDSRGIKIVIPAKESETWDHQFFVKLQEPLQVGDIFRFSMKYKANEEISTSIDTQSHGSTAGGYNHWACVGSLNCTTEWKTLSTTVTVTSDMSKEGNLFQHIAFNLAVSDHETTLYIDDIECDKHTLVPADQNPYYLMLESTVNDNADMAAEAENMDVNKQVCQDYLDAYQAAQEGLNATGEEVDYEGLSAALKDARSLFDSSVKDYQKLTDHIAWVEGKLNAAKDMGENYADMASAIDVTYGELCDARNAKEWGKEEINANTVKDPIKAIIAEAISEKVQDGDDITILLENPDFAGNTNGWEKGEGTKFLDYGPSNRNILDMDNGHNGYLSTGMAEVWHGSFDAYQTLAKLPAGLYTINVNACQRTDVEGSEELNGYLYATVNGKESHVLVMNVYADPSDEMLFDSDADPKWPDVQTDEGGWIPDGKGGANYHLNSGYYLNTLNVLLTEGGDMRLGIKNTATEQWVVMDNFKVIYHSLDNKLANEEALKLLIASAGQMETSSTPTQEALNEAIQNAQEVLENIEEETTESIKNVYDALSEAIDNTNECNVVYAATENFYYDSFAARYSETCEEGNVTCPADVKAAADAADAKQAEMDAMTLQQLKDYLEELKALYGKMLLPVDVETASDNTPTNMTAYAFDGVSIDFEDYSSVGANANYPGWQGSGFGTGGGTAGPVGERWNQTNGFNTYVDVSYLPEGIYTLHCDGAYRIGAGGNMKDYQIAQQDSTSTNPVYLYATTSNGTAQTVFHNIYEALVTAEIAEEKGIAYSADCSKLNIVDSTNVEETVTYTYYTPDQLKTADEFIQAGYYLDNNVTFKVGADGKARLGVQRPKGASNDWCFVDNFKLLYHGTNSKLVPTAITEVKNNTVKAIYTITGVRMNKVNKPGLYIINGKKVFVK